MSIGEVYVVLTVISLFQILLILNRTKRTEHGDVIDKAFINMLRALGLAIGIDMLWGLYFSNFTFYSRIGFIIVGYLFHWSSAITAFMWFTYICKYLRLDEPEKSILSYTKYIIIALQSIVIFSNNLNHAIFYVDYSGNYNAGILRIVTNYLQISYYVILLIAIIIMRIKGRKDRRMFFATIFIIIPSVYIYLQLVFFDMPMNTLGYSFSTVLVFVFNVTFEREQYLVRQFKNLDQQLSSIIESFVGDFEAIYYIDTDDENYEMFRKDDVRGIKKISVGEHYFDKVIENGFKMILEEEQENFRNNFSKEKILSEINHNGMYSVTLPIYRGDTETYFQFRYVKPVSAENTNKLILGVYNVDKSIREEIERQEKDRLFMMDSMTGLFNRNVYDADISKYLLRGPKGNFVYVSFDLNELKLINDNLGHDAGDELIVGAAECIRNCFGQYGKVYRIGGDEFAAMIHIASDKLDKVISKFENTIKEWSGSKVDNVSISYGLASKNDNPKVNIKELAAIADKIMYNNKSLYYAERGIDRMGRIEAYDVICKSYIKILKVNLTEDTFKIIQMDLVEKKKSNGFDEKLSVWLKNFITLGYVQESDVEFFSSKINMDYMKEYFKKGNKMLCIYYNRKIKDDYVKSMVEIIPANEYSNDNQMLFMYIKNISI